MRKKSYWVATANISNSKMLVKSLFFQMERKNKAKDKDKRKIERDC